VVQLRAEAAAGATELISFCREQLATRKKPAASALTSTAFRSTPAPPWRPKIAPDWSVSVVRIEGLISTASIRAKPCVASAAAVDPVPMQITSALRLPLAASAGRCPSRRMYRWANRESPE
jgi:hypothetical protein